ncbi:MAG: isoprenylcysteine carboxylmethyltransferase family protein [Pseudomonas sp.]|uniref:methyltransferase family protein n=1 Tax=Pseudomonas sp. TaxID=306 RepID=UPI003BB72274
MSTVSKPGLLKRALPPPALAVLIGLLMWLLAEPSPDFAMASWLRYPLLALLCISGVVMDSTSVFTFLRRKTVLNPYAPHKASTLVLTGAFRYSRNPMYLGLVLLLSAWGLYLSAWWSVAGPIAFFLYIDRFLIPHEEAALKLVFGEPYLQYLKDVRRWL